MARKTPSRLDLRKQAEAVEARGGGEEAPKKKAARKTATTTSRAKRTKEKAIARKKLVWVVFNGNMKEEGRFPYDQRAAAEEKIEQLKLKSVKKMYFIQPVKELLGGDGKPAPALAAAAGLDDEVKPPRKAKAPKLEDEAEVEEEEAEDDDEDDDDE